MNQAIHTVDLLLWLFGPVARVFGRTAARLHDIEVEDTAVATLEFANGALGTIEAATSAYPGYARRIELTGSAGTAILDGDELVAVDLRGEPGPNDTPGPTRPGLQRPSGEPGPAGSGLHAVRSPENATSPAVSDASAHQRVIEDFIAAFRNRGKPRCDGPDGRRSVQLIEAIYESSRLARPVDL